MGAANRETAERPPAEQPGAESFGPVLVGPARKTPSMRQAIAEARREIATTLPLVVRTLAKESIGGSVHHLKLYLELSGVLKGGLTAPEKQVRERTLEEILVERWEQDKAQAAAEEAEKQQSRFDLKQAERNRERAEEVLSGI